MSRRHPATLPRPAGALEARDCSTCSASMLCPEAEGEFLACELAGDPDGAVQVWRDTQAMLDAFGWPAGAHLSPCPAWTPAWGSES